MANNSRDKMEKDGNASMGLGAAALLGVVGLVAGGIASSNDKKKQEQARAARQEEIEKCNSKISDIDSEIANLRSQFMGSFLNSDSIEQLLSWRKDWVAKRNELMHS